MEGLEQRLRGEEKSFLQLKSTIDDQNQVFSDLDFCFIFRPRLIMLAFSPTSTHDQGPRTARERSRAYLQQPNRPDRRNFIWFRKTRDAAPKKGCLPERYSSNFNFRFRSIIHIPFSLVFYSSIICVSFQFMVCCCRQSQCVTDQPVSGTARETTANARSLVARILRCCRLGKRESLWESVH